MKIIAIQIQGDDDYVKYYKTTEEVASNMFDLQTEFDQWLSKIKGNHPFRIYSEIVEVDGEISTSEYVNTFSFDDFIGWINAEKYNRCVAVRIKNTTNITPVATIYF